LPAFAPVVARLRGEKQQTRLTQPAIETLAIVAYRQPIQRSEIEAIRGVACGEVLRGLLERRLVRIVGRAEELGRPMLYGTTSEFLKVFGLSSLSDLPQSKELRI
jgi:segregation and condensation protein B